VIQLTDKSEMNKPRKVTQITASYV